MSADREKKNIKWGSLATGVLFFVFGLAALGTGKSFVDVSDVQGVNVRIGGGLLCIVGVIFVVLAGRRMR
jgi:hypothetical protein